MNAINNFNVLPFYTSLAKQNGKKWYAFGNIYPLASPRDKILPFQIVMTSTVASVSALTIHNYKTGATIASGLTPTIYTPEGQSYSIIYLKLSTISQLAEGRYYLTITVDGTTLYSEIFNAISDLSEYVKIEYWNEDDLYTKDKIQVYFGDDFKFVMYACTDIGKPEYLFEEELTKRLGYKFLESQVSNKVYKFTFLAPEYLTDSMRIIRLSDYIKLTQGDEEFNALAFAYDAKWEQQGDLASVECEFETDTIIQKLQSFNRRQLESFYNALLSNIDEPILFDTEVVAQYYADFQTGGLIQGKLIHELELETEIKEGAFIPIDNNDSTPAKRISVSLLTASSHIHANKALLDVINQGLSKDSDVEFNSVVAKGAITAGALNGTLPDDLPVSSPLLYGVSKYDDVTIKINANGQWYVATSGGTVVSFGTEVAGQSIQLIVAAITKTLALAGHTHNYQPVDNDLTAIAALTGTGLLKRTGTDTWTFDTNAYLTAITKAMVEAVLTGIITSHRHNYLPINGGNLTGELTILTNKVWHAGNDGVNSGLDADLLDGLHAAAFLRTFGTINGNIDTDYGEGSVTFDPNPAGTLPVFSYNIRTLNIGNNFTRRTQLAFPYDVNRMYMRRRSDVGWDNWIEIYSSAVVNKKTVDWYAKNLYAVNVISDGAVVAGALNGTLPDDLPIATGSLFGVVKTGASLNNNVGVVNINGRHYTTTSTYTDAAVREITAELVLGTGNMTSGTLDQIQLAFAPLTTTRGLTGNIIATATGAGMSLTISFRKDTGSGRWYIMIYNGTTSTVVRDGILISIRGQQTI